MREIYQEIRTAQVQDVTKDVMRVRVPANFALSTLPSDLHRERENASAVVEEERVDGYHRSRFENGAGWGIPNPPPTPHDDGGWHLREAGGLDGDIAIRESSESNDQF